MKALTSFINNEDGQAIVEYALVAFVLVLASYSAIKLIIFAWKIKFNNVKSVRSGPTGVFP